MISKRYLICIVTLLGFNLSESKGFAAAECNELRKGELPKELQNVCKAVHPYGMNKAIRISKTQIAIECVFFSFVPKYSYFIASRGKSSWSLKTVTASEVSSPECFKH